MTDTGIRIDAHVHVWDRTRSAYSWLSGAPSGLSADFTPQAAHEQLVSCGIDGAVLVQADDRDADTDYLLEVASVNSWVSAVVGWIDLDDPVRAERQLTERAQHPVFRGARQLIHDDPRDNVLSRPSVRASAKLIAAAGLSLDIPDAWPRRLREATELARATPELTVVLDHLGKPPRGSDSSDSSGAFGDWARELARFAELPNTVAKVSGLRMPCAEYSAAALLPSWERALEVFGPSRLMYGGDWPMTVPDGGYQPTFAVLETLIGTLSADEQTEVMGGCAVRTYRMSSVQ